MSDDDLRALEREVAASGSAAARLRLAAAYERRGEKKRAFEVLLPARQDADVRRELGRWPVWNGTVRRLGADTFVDVDALVEPQRSWTFDTTAIEGGPARVLHVNAFGLVCWSASGTIVVLDAVTGQIIWGDPDAAAEKLVVVGDVLLAVRQGRAHVVTALDLWTGAVLFSSELPERWTYLRDLKLLVVEHASGQIGAWDVRDARSVPRRAWMTPTWVASDAGLSGQEFGCVGEFVTSQSRSGTVAIDKTGSVAWRTNLCGRSDAHGLVGSPALGGLRSEVDPYRISAVDAGGRPSWESPERGTVVGLAREFVLAMVDYERSFAIVMLDRNTGRFHHDIRALAGFGASALVRGTLYSYHPDRGLVTTRPDGTQLWAVPRSDLGDELIALAPVEGRLFTLGRSGLITCWTDS